MNFSMKRWRSWLSTDPMDYRCGDWQRGSV
jgi:hypothetical protein